MTYIAYEDWEPRGTAKAIINHARRIISEYQADGYVLTLRQLYYQFVARDLIPNKQAEYDRLGRVMVRARLAGFISWDALEDRTRELKELNTWASPRAFLKEAQGWYREKLWRTQPFRVEVWVEKQALEGVFQRICNQLRVPFFSCRGYSSLSEMHVAAQRLRTYREDFGQDPLILHFGDHDPSGMDMTRDIEDRMDTFGLGMNYYVALEVDRLALNMNQVEQYKPPPNPAKLTDSRAPEYVARYGLQSWELDALDPKTLAGLVRGAVEAVRDDEAWDQAVAEEEDSDALLVAAEEHWDDVEAMLRERMKE